MAQTAVERESISDLLDETEIEVNEKVNEDNNHPVLNENMLGTTVCKETEQSAVEEEYICEQVGDRVNR